MKILPLLAWLTCLSTLSAQTISNYQFTISSQNPSAYFKLDGTLADAVTPAQMLNPFNGYFTADLGRRATNAYGFLNQGDTLQLPTDIINGGDATGTNGAANATGSLSVLFRSLDNSSTGQRFIFSQGTGATSNGNAFELYFENSTTTNGGAGDLKLRVGSSTTSILLSNAIVYNEWYYFAMTWDEARDAGEVNWYVGLAGSTLNTGTHNTGNDAVMGDNGILAIGNQIDFSSGYRNPGIGRIDEFAVWNRELTGTEITNQFTKLPNFLLANALYQDLVTAQLPAYYFKLDNSLVDSVGNTLNLEAGGPSGSFANDIFGDPNQAYTFDATNDVLSITNDLINGGGAGANPFATAVGSITLIFKMLSDTNNTGQRFIFSQGAGTSPTRNQMSLFLENTNVANSNANSLKLRMGNGPTTTMLLAEEIITNAWYFFAMAYDEARNSNSGGEIRWFIGPVGGTLKLGNIDIANDSVIGDHGIFYIGNNRTLQNAFRNPGNGVIDEFAIWHDELSPDEIKAQFAAVTNSPSVAPAPSLRITLESPNVLISWPAVTSTAYFLESTPTLSSPSWTSNGPPTLVGGEFVVTNSISGVQFYRLHKP